VCFMIHYCSIKCRLLTNQMLLCNFVHRYPDLKPPPSPTAWPPKVVKRVNPTIATTRKVECSNGGGEHKEKHKLETANPSGFKWPWQA
jgi:hypothetical protein